MRAPLGVEVRRRVANSQHQRMQICTRPAGVRRDAGGDGDVGLILHDRQLPPRLRKDRVEKLCASAGGVRDRLRSNGTGQRVDFEDCTTHERRDPHQLHGGRVNTAHRHATRVERACEQRGERVRRSVERETKCTTGGSGERSLKTACWRMCVIELLNVNRDLALPK